MFEGKVTHIMQRAFEQGAVYRVYVSQVNKFGKESALSESNEITIGGGGDTTVADDH